MFTRIKWLFEQKRIVLRQYSIIYGKGLYKRLHSNRKGKFSYGVRFCKFIYYLELRLNILITRLRLTEKIFDANILIYLKLVCVNGSYKHKHYLVKIGDIIRLFFFKKFITSICRKTRFLGKAWE